MGAFDFSRAPCCVFRIAYSVTLFYGIDGIWHSRGGSSLLHLTTCGRVIGESPIELKRGCFISVECLATYSVLLITYSSINNTEYGIRNNLSNSFEMHPNETHTNQKAHISAGFLSVLPIEILWLCIRRQVV